MLAQEDWQNCGSWRRNCYGNKGRSWSNGVGQFQTTGPEAV